MRSYLRGQVARQTSAKSQVGLFTSEGEPVQKTILLAEDDDSVRKLLGRILHKAGYAVIEACDGIKALELWAERPGDLIITDLNMPRMGGEQLIQQLLSANRQLRFLIITARPKTLPEDWPCLDKPFLPEALLQRVDWLLRSDLPTYGYV